MDTNTLNSSGDVDRLGPLYLIPDDYEVEHETCEEDFECVEDEISQDIAAYPLYLELCRDAEIEVDAEDVYAYGDSSMRLEEDLCFISGNIYLDVDSTNDENVDHDK